MPAALHATPPRRRLTISIVALLAAGFMASFASPVDAVPKGTKVVTYKDGLAFPVDMAWVRGSNKIFFTEKGGNIRVMVGKKLLGTPCKRLDVNSAGERGALGIVLHPQFESNHYLYVFYTKASPLEHRVTRFTVRKNRCKSAKHIVTGLNASSSGYHNGGQLEFAGGKLFVTTGEAHSPSLAQDTGNRLGKVLRYNPGGGIPNDNPFGNDNPVWSYGHRNPFGLARKPGSKRLYSTENGPSCDDELNLIKKGRNYGWGSGYSCGTNGVGSNPKGPLRRWSSVIVPTDPWWYKGDLRRLNGSLYVGDFGGRLHRIGFTNNGKKLDFDRVIHSAPNGITDVSIGPGGKLYFLTTQAIYRIVRK
jgi:aldose sugar dehydrogenase